MDIISQRERPLNLDSGAHARRPFDFLVQTGAATSHTPRITVLGQTSVDRRKVKAARPLEFVVALAVAGGSMSREGAINRIFSSEACGSAVPTLAYRARKLGIDITYDAGAARYRLNQPVLVDALEVIRLAHAGNARDALCSYAGTCLPGSTSPFAESLRLEVESALVAAIVDSGDDELLGAGCRALDHWNLAEAAIERRCEPLAVVLGRSYLRGGDLLS